VVTAQSSGATSRGKQFFSTLDGREMRFGYATSWETLIPFGIEFSTLRELSSQTGLPIGEIGSAFSTLPYEAIALDTDWRTVDPLFSPDHSLAILVDTLLASLGSTDTKFRSWYKQHGRQAKRIVMARHISRRLEDLSEQQMFAATIVTNALPKYSDRNRFIQTQLPALLRRTACVAYVYPLSVWSPLASDSDNRLVCTDRLYNDPQYLAQLSETAATYGFGLELRTPDPLVADRSPIMALREFMPGLSIDFMHELDQPSLAIFRSLGS
jgi:hypothetical protein